MPLSSLLYWRHKSPKDNAWHPLPSGNPQTYHNNLPASFKRMDIHATAVDVAPFVAGIGGLTHLRQAMSFDFTAHFSIFKNPRTLTAMHRTTAFLAPLVLGCQALGWEYRDFVPRWAHEREARRDEGEVRQHVDVGMWIGSVVYLGRMLGKVGVRYWAPVEIVMGGALADLMQREYMKAHGL